MSPSFGAVMTIFVCRVPAKVLDKEVIIQFVETSLPRVTLGKEFTEYFSEALGKATFFDICMRAPCI